MERGKKKIIKRPPQNTSLPYLKGADEGGRGEGIKLYEKLAFLTSDRSCEELGSRWFVRLRLHHLPSSIQGP
jgi:hypothetical protein